MPEMWVQFTFHGPHTLLTGILPLACLLSQTAIECHVVSGRVKVHMISATFGCQCAYGEDLTVEMKMMRSSWPW